MLLKLIKKLFANWEVVYSTKDFAEYTTMKGRLEEAGIPYKKKTLDSGSSQGGGNGFAATYQLLVPEELIQKAQEAIDYSNT